MLHADVFARIVMQFSGTATRVIGDRTVDELVAAKLGIHTVVEVKLPQLHQYCAAVSGAGCVA